MTKSGFDLDEIERLRERLGSVSSAMMEGDNLAILLCGYFDNPDQDGSDDDCGWTPDGLAGYTEVCDAIHAHYAPTLTAMLTEIRELRAENARKTAALERRPWPPTEAELREMLASIVAEWWSKSTAHYIRTARNLRPEDIKGLYAVREALAPYVDRAALGEPQ